MPTGYTAEIISGEMTEFEDFALKCLEAFGGNRDGNNIVDGKFAFRPLNTYYTENIALNLSEISRLNNMSDEEMVADFKEDVEKDIVRYETYMRAIQENYVALTNMLDKAKAYNPPTDKHEGIANFMIQQLETTINADADISYYSKMLAIKKNLLNRLPSGKQIRDELVASLKEDIERHEDGEKEAIKTHKESVQWIKDYLDSIGKSDLY